MILPYPDLFMDIRVAFNAGSLAALGLMKMAPLLSRRASQAHKAPKGTQGGLGAPGDSYVWTFRLSTAGIAHKNLINRLDHLMIYSILGVYEAVCTCT